HVSVQADILRAGGRLESGRGFADPELRCLAALAARIIFGRAERSALKAVTDRVGRKLRLLRHGVVTKVFRPALRAVAEASGVAVVPPGRFVVGGAIENFETNVGMLKSNADKLNKVFRLDPDRQSSLVERPVIHIADTDAGHAQPMLVCIERTDCFAKSLAHSIATVRPHGDIDANLLVARIKSDRVV